MLLMSYFAQAMEAVYKPPPLPKETPTMIDYRTNKRLCNAVLWLIGACILAAFVSSCSPLAAMSKNLDTPTPAPSVTAIPTHSNMERVEPTPRPSTCTVSTGVPAGNLNIRSGPGTAYPVIGLLHEGESLQVIGAGAWLEVIAGNLSGHINSKYCKVKP
jgi:uncharacterized protein YgiM (DUF1202 family)